MADNLIFSAAIIKISSTQKNDKSGSQLNLEGFLKLKDSNLSKEKSKLSQQKIVVQKRKTLISKFETLSVGVENPLTMILI